MLYEVITSYAAAAEAPPAVPVTPTASRPAPAAPPVNIERMLGERPEQRRITSYNVCYTKLLRFRCHSTMNCVDVCPKNLNPTRAIGKIKEIMVRRAV